MVKNQPLFGVLISFWLNLLTTPALGAQEQSNKQSVDDIPNQKLLEFIADFGTTDDETFDLMIHHGKKDLEKSDETSTSQEPTHEK